MQEGTDAEERAIALAPAASIESPQFRSFALRHACMVSSLCILQSSSPCSEPAVNRVGMSPAQCFSNVPVHRLSAIGGAAMVSLAMRLAHFSCGPFAKSVRLATIRIIQRIFAIQASATPEHMVWQGQCFYKVSNYACAAERWQSAVDIGCPLAHALLANLLIDGRPGLPHDRNRAFFLASAGARLGCAHSRGVLGRCYSGSYGVAQSIESAFELARQSAAAGSCFGKFVLGVCCLLYTSPSPRDRQKSRMPSSA